MTYIARCCCRACELAVEGEPVLNGVCHCWSAYFQDAAVVSRRGDFARYHVATTDSDRFFCAACGTTLYWTSGAFMAGNIGVAGGCFTETPLPEPTLSARDAQRCAWVGLPQTWLAAP